MFVSFKRLAPIATLALGTALTGCSMAMDWGEVEGVPLAEFDTSGAPPSEVVLAGPDRIVITEGDGLTITVEGNGEASDALRFDRDGERLTIARDSKIFDGSQEATVRITMPPAATLGVAGSGSIQASTMASVANIEIVGAGDISVETLDAEEVEVEIAGSGTARASGTATTLDIEIAGSGDVEFAGLTADTVSVEIAGSGDVDVASNGTVDAEIAGSGDIRVTGNATCSLDNAGSGTLTCRPAPASAAATEAEDAAAE